MPVSVNFFRILFENKVTKKNSFKNSNYNYYMTPKEAM